MLNCLWLFRTSTGPAAPFRRLAALMLLLSVVVLPRNGWPALAAPTESSNWENWDEGLPSFAPVVSLAVDPKHPTTLYAGTYSLPGLWRSADSGETWEWVSQAETNSPCSHPVFVLMWDAGRQYWWAGTAGGLFFRPAASATWQLVPDLNGPVFSLALDATGHLYAVEADEGLFRQKEDGSWTRVHREPRALVVAVSSTGRHVFLGTAGNGLWVSDDGGEKWLQAPDWREEYVSSLLVDQDEGRWVYASTSTQVYRSQDFGRTWQPVAELDDRAHAFALAPDGVLYVGLNGRIARSQDGGQTWGYGSAGLHPQMPVLDLSTVQQPGGGYALYAATRDGVYWSTDQGRTWQRHRKGLGDAEVEALTWDGEGGMLAATPSGLYRRPLGEEKWEPVAQAFGYKRFYALSGDADFHTIYAGMQSGLVRSTDGGKTWQEVISNLTPLGIPGILVDPQDPNHLFIRLAFERVYESQDGGEAWESRWEGMETHHVVLSITRSPSGELWAGTQDGLFGWDEQGKRWRREPLPLENQSVFAIAFDPEGRAAFVGATGGLWCRRDGNHWQRCAAKRIDHTVTALAALPKGHVYAGTKYGGLYRSCDTGFTWHRVSGIPLESSVNDLLVDTMNGMVYAATDHGLFRGKDTACPPLSKTLHWNGIWEESGDLVWLKRVLSLPQSYSPIRSLPAVHTLRADDALLRQASDIGFRAVVQVLSWEESEPTEGQLHWEYPDFLVRSADFYDLDLVVRLDHPPDWALQPKDIPSDGHAAPFDVDAYLRFIEAVVRRYQGAIQGYIIWNEPNLAWEWGAPPDPVAYTRLLQRAYVVVKQTDPLALVISAGLAPTNTMADNDEQGGQAIDDRIFLEKMYQAGARPFFDVLGVHPYGFAYPPDDPPGAHDGFNMNRILDLRATMEAYGDGSKPVWATEVGWTTHGTGEHAWLTVTPEQQADYLVRAWWKTREEYPWWKGFTVWNLSRELPEQDEKAGYNLLYDDGTPKPACESLREAFSSADLETNVPDPGKILNWFFPASSPVLFLARDEEVHLGDSE